MTSWSEFLSLVLPVEGTGYYCVGSYKKKAHRITHFATTLQDTEKYIQELLDDKKDVYFGVSKFITSDSREAKNAGWEKAFFVDLDCGQEYAEKGKGYTSQVEALNDLRRFCDETGLPKPNIVNSGNGIHVSWVMSDHIMRDEWKAAAEIFKNKLRHHDLKIDPSKVTDPAMVLRVPDTLNFKSDPPKPVVWVNRAAPMDFNEFKRLTSQGLENLGLDLTKPPRRPMDDTTRALLGNYVANFTDIMKSKGCNQLIYIYQNQDTIEEPLWRGGLSIAQVCEDRDTAIHKLSSKHPEYSAKETELKADATGGPYKCTTLENLNPGGCDGCPNKNKITSPVQLGKKLIRATEEDNIVTLPSVEIGRTVTYQIPEYPFPYFRGRNGGVYKTGFTKEDGEEVEKDQLIFKYDFYVVKRMVDEELGEMIWLRVHMPKDGVREFALPAMSLVSGDEFKKIVSKYGVIGTLKEMQAIMEYVTKFAQYLQDLNEAEKMRNQFGWCDNDTKFIIGEREVSAEGVKYSPPSNQTAFFVPNFRPMGTMEEWQRCVEVYSRPGNEARAFLFFVGFGAPLLKFTNQKGLIFSITENESAGGKTTIQRMANSIWGHPTEMMLIKRDTMKSKYHQMGVHNNILVCIDEVTGMSDEDCSEISYAISQGRGNNRMKNNSNEMRANHTKWALPCIMSGNDSMHEKIARLKATPESEQLRIVEVEIAPDPTMTKAQSDELFEHVLPDNYGHAGVPLMEYMVPNIKEVRKLLKKTQEEFDNEANLSQKQRFYSAGAAIAFTGAIIAKELGLHNIDIAPVWKWAVQHFSDLKQSVKPATRNPSETLGKFLNTHIRNILIIESTVDKRTGLMKPPIKEPYGDLLIRYEPDTKLLFIDSEAFQSWCTDRQITYRSTVKMLKEMADAEITSKAMAKGTPLSTPSVSVLKLNDAKLNIVDVEALKALNTPTEDDK